MIRRSQSWLSLSQQPDFGELIGTAGTADSRRAGERQRQLTAAGCLHGYVELHRLDWQLLFHERMDLVRLVRDQSYQAVRVEHIAGIDDTHTIARRSIQSGVAHRQGRVPK